MAQEHLGLFDTPPDQREVRFSLIICGMLFGALFLIFPLRNIRLPEVNAFIPTIDAIMFVGELITATLLYAQAAVFRSRALAVLASGFLFSAILIVPHALTFPGAFTPDGLLDAGVNTTAWISSFRRAAFPIAIILYVQLKQADGAALAGIERPVPRIVEGMLAASALAFGTTVLTTIGHDTLPPYFINHTDLRFEYAVGYQAVTFVFFMVATVLLFRKRNSVLDMWLLVALWGWLVETVLIMQLHSRFTAGWYGLYMVTLFSHLVVMLALIAESNRLYARLALQTAARSRERDARLMTMDAVTAAISHEVGQPLSAVNTNATAALNWLTRKKPDPDKAIEALRATVGAGQRTFDVIRSIRAMFAQGPGPATEYSLNELVQETAKLLDRELTGKKISLELNLDDALPPVLADRVQMQRVLVNLLTNAMDSLEVTRRRRRRIEIRSEPLDGQDVLLEVRDTGIGVAPDHLSHIFDAFFTTKATGTGLGLSLCRSIVEEHGGRLWASLGEPHGLIFHLRLPRSS